MGFCYAKRAPDGRLARGGRGLTKTFVFERVLAQHYLGHKNIQHTVRYTELSPERFKTFWED